MTRVFHENQGGIFLGPFWPLEDQKSPFVKLATHDCGIILRFFYP